MLQHPGNPRGNERDQQRTNDDFRTQHINSKQTGHRNQENVLTGKDKNIEWTSRLSAIDYDRNAE